MSCTWRRKVAINVPCSNKLIPPSISVGCVGDQYKGMQPTWQVVLSACAGMRKELLAVTGGALEITEISGMPQATEVPSIDLATERSYSVNHV